MGSDRFATAGWRERHVGAGEWAIHTYTYRVGWLVPTDVAGDTDPADSRSTTERADDTFSLPRVGPRLKLRLGGKGCADDM